MIDKHNRCLGGLWFVQDICGIICAIFTYFLILFAQYVVMMCILLPEENSLYKVVNIVIYEILFFLAISSHMRTMLTDPGAVPRGTATKEAIESLGKLTNISDEKKIHTIIIILKFEQDL